MKFRDNFNLLFIAVQRHPRLLMLVPMINACRFLLATNSNFGHISYRFQVIDV